MPVSGPSLPQSGTTLPHYLGAPYPAVSPAIQEHPTRAGLLLGGVWAGLVVVDLWQLPAAWDIFLFILAAVKGALSWRWPLLTGHWLVSGWIAG